MLAGQGEDGRKRKTEERGQWKPHRFLSCELVENRGQKLRAFKDSFEPFEAHVTGAGLSGIREDGCRILKTWTLPERADVPDLSEEHDI